MTKYLLNENIHGYEKITVDDVEKTDGSNNLFVVVIDKGIDNKTGHYYKFINRALRNKNRVIAVGLNDENIID